MKKKILKLTGASILTVVLAAVLAYGLLMLIRNYNVAETGNVLGVSWYNETDTEFVISTKEELYEFAKLSDFYDFEKQTIKLDADIVINEGSAKDWETDAPKEQWNPIAGFAGTFDGQGHTISGLYAKTLSVYTAMFINTSYKCKIQDVKLVNSYIETAGRSGTASFIAGGAGTFVKLYSDAILNNRGENVAGIASMINAQSTFEECWFAGTIHTTQRDCGGIVDEIIGASVMMRHCLFSGEINSIYDFAGTRTGGLCGRVDKMGTLSIQDCLSSGKINAARNTYTGGIIGATYSGVEIATTDTYLSDATYSLVIGDAGSKGTFRGNALQLRNEDLIGVNAYRWSTLDFDNYWSAVDGGTPVLTCFAGEGLKLDGLEKAYDTSWYKSGLYTFELTTREQIYGLYMLAAVDDFSGKIVKLGADIVINQGDADKWEENKPEYPWYPITGFAGLFDGQGHTLSGIYVNTDSSYQGVFGQTTTTTVIKNFNLKNSYFRYEGENFAAIGSIAGELRGKMENVYSDAIVISYGRQAGGLVGRANDNDSNGKPDEISISNCWFAGELTMKGESNQYGGGIVGVLVQGDLDVSHCLNTGTISSEAIDIGVQVGGIIGVTWGAGVFNLSDSLNTGKINVKYNTCVGAVIGRGKDATNTINITNTYATNDSYTRGVGNATSATVNGGVIRLDRSLLTGNNAYRFTELDFPNYWAFVSNSTPVLQSFGGTDPSTAGLSKVMDTTWYNKDAKEFVINTEKELFGFAMISASTNFAGQTVKLGKDIAVSTKGWITIGSPEKSFAGTFDGQGHTISGLYMKSDDQYVALFGMTTPTSMLKNFSIKDSYFCYESEESRAKEVRVNVGSVCGDMRGSIENIYSNATIESTASRAGGIVSVANSLLVDGKRVTASIQNCWFDGVVKLTGNNARRAGGIVGISMQGNVLIKNCLNTGAISNDKNDAAEFLGGIIGSDQNASHVYIEDCLNAGSVTAARYNGVAAIVGMANLKDSVYTLKNVYAVDKSCVTDAGVVSTTTRYKGKIEGTVNVVKESKLLGIESIYNTWLDFEQHWVARVDKVPGLKGLAEQSECLSVPEMIAHDTSWYDGKSNTYTLESVSEFYGFADLVNRDKQSFEGITIKISKDLDVLELNVIDENTLAAWESGAEKGINRWLPIGTQNGTQFKGNFDGQNCVIKGLYVENDGDRGTGLFGCVNGGTIQNFGIQDSCFKNTNGSTARMGSVIGWFLGGTLQNVHSEAMLYSDAACVGGLVGVSENTTTMSSCWYNGKLTVEFYGEKALEIGGIIGHAYKGTTYMDACLYSGTIDINFRSTEVKDRWKCVGGLIGTSHNTNNTLALENSISAGEIHLIWIASDECPIRTFNGFGAVTGNTNTRTSITDTYATTLIKVTDSKGVNQTVKTSAPNKNGTYEVVDTYMANENALYGATGAANLLNLDFTNIDGAKAFWVTRENALPVPKTLGGFCSEIASGLILHDKTWFTGEENAIYVINSASEFFGFADLVNIDKQSFENATVKVVEDLDNIKLNEIDTSILNAWKTGTKQAVNSWTPIGAEGNPFKGVFDGQDCIIRGMYVTNNSAKGTGLFGCIDGGTIRNISLQDSYIKHTGTNVARLGSIVGYSLGGTLENIHSKTEIDSTAREVGGLVGTVATGTTTIRSCWYDGEIVADIEQSNPPNIGGIVGNSYSGRTAMNACLYTGTVDVTYAPLKSLSAYWLNVAGFCGYNRNTLTIANSICAGEVHVEWVKTEIDTDGGTAMGVAAITNESKASTNIQTTYAMTIVKITDKNGTDVKSTKALYASNKDATVSISTDYIGGGNEITELYGESGKTKLANLSFSKTDNNTLVWSIREKALPIPSTLSIYCSNE